MSLRELKETVPPPECSALDYVEAIGDLVERQPVAQGQNLPDPFSAYVQPN